MLWFETWTGTCCTLRFDQGNISSSHSASLRAVIKLYYTEDPTFPKWARKKQREADGGATARAQLDLLSELSSVCCQTCFLFSKNLLKWKIAINTPGDKWLKLKQVFGLIQRNIKSSSRSYRRALRISRKWLSDLFRNNSCSVPHCCGWATNASIADQLKCCSVCGLHPSASALQSWGCRASAGVVFSSTHASTRWRVDLKNVCAKKNDANRMSERFTDYFIWRGLHRDFG